MGTGHEPSVHVSSSDQFGSTPGKLVHNIFRCGSQQFNIQSNCDRGRVAGYLEFIMFCSFQLLWVEINRLRARDSHGPVTSLLLKDNFEAKGTNFGRRRQLLKAGRKFGTLLERQLKQKIIHWRKLSSMEQTLHFQQVSNRSISSDLCFEVDGSSQNNARNLLVSEFIEEYL